MGDWQEIYSTQDGRQHPGATEDRHREQAGLGGIPEEWRAVCEAISLPRRRNLSRLWLQQRNLHGRFVHGNRVARTYDSSRARPVRGTRRALVVVQRRRWRLG